MLEVRTKAWTVDEGTVATARRFAVPLTLISWKCWSGREALLLLGDAVWMITFGLISDIRALMLAGLERSAAL